MRRTLLKRIHEKKPKFHSHGSLLSSVKLLCNHFSGEQDLTEASDAPIYISREGKGVIGSVPSMSKSVIRKKIQQSFAMYTVWRDMSHKARSELFYTLADLMKHHKHDLAHLANRADGVAEEEAEKEVLKMIKLVEYGAQSVYNIPKGLWKASGVIGVINRRSPSHVFSEYVTNITAPLISGSTVIAYPSHESPFSALALSHLMHSAGFPQHTLTLVTGKLDVVRTEFLHNGLVAKFVFPREANSAFAALTPDDLTRSVNYFSLGLKEYTESNLVGVSRLSQFLSSTVNMAQSTSQSSHSSKQPARQRVKLDVKFDSKTMEPTAMVPITTPPEFTAEEDQAMKSLDVNALLKKSEEIRQLTLQQFPVRSAPPQAETSDDSDYEVIGRGRYGREAADGQQPSPSLSGLQGVKPSMIRRSK